ncbi:MAG: hypothetical protein L6V93_21710 [Clostridiales bacterium]|nr:MAG: hypothetical protein L6V93_21710 [Clostridiales bacterium]
MIPTFFSGDFIHYDTLAEFNLPEHAFKIVCVSRLDVEQHQRGICAF